MFRLYLEDRTRATGYRISHRKGARVGYGFTDSLVCLVLCCVPFRPRPPPRAFAYASVGFDGSAMVKQNGKGCIDDILSAGTLN